MIKCEKGTVEVSGSKISILYEYVCVTKAILNGFLEKGESKEHVREMLTDSLETAFLSKEELSERASEAREQFFEKIMGVLDGMLDESDDGLSS